MNHHVSPARLERVLTALDEYWAENCCPPSLRELAASMGLSAASNMRAVLAVAAEQGLVLVVDRRDGPAYVPLWVYAAVRTAWNRQGVTATPRDAEKHGSGMP